jgi:transcriptional regulator with XRE-family HTH domain
MMTVMDVPTLTAIAANHQRGLDGSARAIRLRAGWTLARMARQLGVHESAVGRWENGRRQPRGDVALRWARLVDELERQNQQQPAA